MNLWELHCIGKNVCLVCLYCLLLVLAGLLVLLAGLLVVLVWFVCIACWFACGACLACWWWEFPICLASRLLTALCYLETTRQQQAETQTTDRHSENRQTARQADDFPICLACPTPDCTLLSGNNQTTGRDSDNRQTLRKQTDSKTGR